MELEKKKSRPTKRTFSGPTIRYHSLTMPAMRKPTRGANPAVDSKDLAGKCERTFVTIENDFNDKVFQSLFRHKAPPKASNGICPITRLPARYFDPITQQPYYSIRPSKFCARPTTCSWNSKAAAASSPNWPNGWNGASWSRRIV